MSRMTSSATWPGTWYSAGRRAGAGDKQVVERRVAVERHVAPEARDAFHCANSSVVT